MKNPRRDALDFVALDFETAQYARESAIAVGLVRFSGGRETDVCHSLIKPPKLYVRPDFTAIHGLRAEDVRDAPVFSEVWERVAAPFIGGCPVVAHNAAFDMGVLRAALSWYGLAAAGLRYFCSLRIARTAWRELPSHALPSLAARFGIVYKAHDALDDARTCGDIVNRAAARFGCADLGGLLRRAGTGFRTL